MPNNPKFLDIAGLSEYHQKASQLYESLITEKINESAPTEMGASGTNHKAGLVPDPGATQGDTKFLREDGTWAVPAGGSGGGGGGDTNVIESISVNNVAQTVDANKNVNITVPVAAQAMASGDTGYVTGDMLYTVMSDIETFLANY